MARNGAPLTTLGIPNVTRVEVVDEEGRAFAGYYLAGDSTAQLQDEGRTLKIFVGVPIHRAQWRDTR